MSESSEAEDAVEEAIQDHPEELIEGMSAAPRALQLVQEGKDLDEITEVIEEEYNELAAKATRHTLEGIDFTGGDSACDAE